MKKLIVTLALAASMLTAAGAATATTTATATATAHPGSHVCLRLLHAIENGTPLSALPPTLLRRCFGPGSHLCRRLRHAIEAGTPISALPPTLLRLCFGHDGPGWPPAGVAPAAQESPAPAPARGG